jgi:acyl-CoA-binding protein
MTDVTDDQFLALAALVANKSIKPVRTATYGERCRLYGLYKKVTLGRLLPPFNPDEDIETETRPQRPGLLAIEGRAKYDAWESCQKLSKAEARNEYAQLVVSTIGAAATQILERG